ncbi:YaaL family protein [Geobacillus subterraneus]|uniref:YaaL family protein n=1 Tax=Geobacillus subterraneus TaxID=129338 RepID=UPI00161250BE
MLWRRKGKLKRQFDEKLIAELQNARTEWLEQKQLIEKSVDPSLEVLSALQLAEAKYFFLLREAKHRRITLKEVR